MLAFSLLLTLSGAVETAEVSRPVLLMRLSCTDEKVCSLFDGSLAEALTATPGVEVLTFDDIQQMADIEAEAKAAGCDEYSCMAEIASALGASRVLYGTATEVGDTWVIQLTLLNASEVRAELRGEVRGEGALAASDLLEEKVREWFGPAEEPEVAAATPLPWGMIGAGTTTALGAIVLVVGVIGVAGAEAEYNNLLGNGEPPSSSKVEELRGQKAAGWAWFGAAAAGAVVTAAGGVWLGVALAE